MPDRLRYPPAARVHLARGAGRTWPPAPGFVILRASGADCSTRALCRS